MDDTQNRYAPQLGEAAAELLVSAAAVVVDGRLLVVSKTAAPDLFYLPGGKPEPGEALHAALVRELDEELGVVPRAVAPLTEIRATAALEGVPMRLVVFRAALDEPPRAAAEIAALRWTDGKDVRLAPAIRDHVVPLVL
ncbi:NUDIX domain-containing protein [Streptomyces diacarni]|uniref:NUDIX hydrolase n=1 Tax=Streptomyces diacarni TaxID=2800381 RepID=UPI0033E4EAB2